MSSEDDVEAYGSGRPAMRRAVAAAARVAPLEISVLITGARESRRWLARWIHAHSRLADRPFVPVDCAAFPDMPVDCNLLDDRRGPYSGVVSGILDAACGGTVFLDDIGEVSKTLQLELIRVFEEPLPQPKDHVLRPRTPVRVIAATARNLKDEVAAGRFRADLFTCVSGAQVHIPPSRKWPGDRWNLFTVDRLVHEPARLAILAVLTASRAGDILFLQSKTGLSQGNISNHLATLEEAGLVVIIRTIRHGRPHTMVRVTPEGMQRYAAYWEHLEALRHKSADGRFTFRDRS
jgi:transcriptional regulator with GAF, ATPase, and Fis domain